MQQHLLPTPALKLRQQQIFGLASRQWRNGGYGMSIAGVRHRCASHRQTIKGDRVMPTERTASRAATSGRSAIIDMLKADHKKVRKAFRDFEKLDPEEDSEQCEAIVEQTLADLQVHATLEEELFYPAARSCLSDGELIDEAEVEHMTVKVLIEQLKNMKADDEKYAAMFKVLGEYINHHVKEEEGELFPKLSRAKFEWDRLHEEMGSRRGELEQQFMPHGAAVPDEDMEGEDAQAGATSKSASRSRGGSSASRGTRSEGGSARAQAAGKQDEEEE